MLSARAYSLRQKSRLAISLSWIGGYTNVIGLLSIGSLVSHVTGSTTHLGYALIAGDMNHAWFFAVLILTFMGGAVVSALMTETARLRGWRSKYILPVALEALTLVAVCEWIRFVRLNPMELHTPVAGLASFAMGLQNATITKVSGSVVRTTHLTGIVTDLGLEGVQYLLWCAEKMKARRWSRAGRLLRVSSRHPSAIRLALLLSIFGSFSFGVLAGAAAYTYLGKWGVCAPETALYAPVAFLLWIIFVDVRTPIADIRELDLLHDPELQMPEVITKLLSPEVVVYRFACAKGHMAHRAPNFHLWVERVPDHCRVVILAMSPLTRFDENAILDMEDAVRRLRSAGRTLVISGITPAQFKAIDALGVARMMDPANICPDIEFAIARALNLLEELGIQPTAGGVKPQKRSA
jgi:uncharacterized membrane protein YoaK (UPF0700 family)/anti-anti-sigma regulatory factor